MLLLFGRGAFLTDGLQANARLPEAPPTPVPSESLDAFFAGLLGLPIVRSVGKTALP
jgi:hypothetical protein